MSVPDPPASGLDPRLVVRKAKRIVFRVHSTAFAASAFNPGFGTDRFHLRRLKLKRSQLLEAYESYYSVTARWAEALHKAAPTAHGMVWVSRQFDTAKSILLFGDRVSSTALEPSSNPQVLDAGRGLRLVQKAASAADITLATG